MKLFDMFDELDELRIDNVNGWGAVPDNQNVDYKGLRVMMRPSMFLKLAHNLPQAFTASDIEKHLRSDGAIGAPFLILAVPQDWFEGDLSLPAEIYGHEGRNRMTAAMRVEGDEPVEVHLFFGGGIRNRDLTPEIIDRLNGDVVSERGDLTKGPWFSTRSMGETITVNLSKDPEYFGADVDDDDQDDYPIVQIRMDELVGFEPDNKMLSPKSKSNMEKMIRLLKAGKGDKLPPILARRYRGGYQVLDGHHRYHAYKAIGAKTIPAVIIPPENITGDIDESLRSNNAQREADDARTFSLRMTSTGIGYALEFADDSKSLYYKTPELDKELNIFKTRILDWLDKTIKDNMQEGIVAYNLVQRIAPQGWMELRTWWDDRKADILRTLLTMVQDRRFDAVYNLIMLHLRKKLGLKWPELDVIVNSCLTEIRRRSISNEDVEEAWSNKYKKSINCSNPKGFSQKAHCAARRKRVKGGSTKSKPVHEAAFDMKRYADQARSAMAVGWLDNAIQGMTYGVKVGKVVAAQPIKDLLDENRDAIIKYILKLMASHQAAHKENYLEDVVSMLRKLEIDWPELAVIEKSIAADINENFADGKGPGRPGDSRRHGIPKNATLAQLDKIGKGSGRKAQLARWQANMRRGRKKSVNEQKSNDHWIRYSKTLKDYLSRDDILDILGDLNAAVEDYGLTARPDIADAIEHNKNNIMRWMLSLMKSRPAEIVDSLLSPSLRAFSKLGIDWPELQVIKNSISTDLRETIAPHGDPHNELKMLQAGTKPAALVNPWEFDKLYRPIIDGMGWEVIEYEIEGFDGHRFYVIAQPGEKARAQRIVQLVQYANRLVTAGGKVGPDYHRELGFLLGYKQADIDHFLRNLYGDEHVAEGDVIKTKFIDRQAQKNKTPYVFNQEIADRIPLYDPKGRFGTYHKSGNLLHGDEVPFSRFEVAEKNDRIASLIGVAPDGKKFVVSTSPPKLAHALADAFNRGGFTDLDLQPISLGPTRTDEEQRIGAALTVFDIDETLFHTAAKILVIKDGEVVKELDNRQFNTYVLQDGESFDFSQFTNAQFFHDTSVPIDTMWKRAKSTLDGIGRRPGSKVIIVTARSDFDDKEMFLNTFRKHGLDIDKIHVHRAGNLNMPSAAAKKKIIGQYLATGQFDMVRLFDDAESNLRSFLSLKDEFPEITFKAYMVLDDGSIREYRT